MRHLACLAFFLLAGCFPYRSTAFYPAAELAADRSFSLRPGAAQVFEVCRQWSAPVPDAASGWCFYLAVEPALVRPGRELAIPGAGVRPELWKLAGAPRTDRSRAAVGVLRIRSVGPERIVAELAVRDDSIPGGWRLDGTRAFRRRSIPEPLPPYSPPTPPPGAAGGEIAVAIP